MIFQLLAQNSDHLWLLIAIAFAPIWNIYDYETCMFFIVKCKTQDCWHSMKIPIYIQRVIFLLCHHSNRPKATDHDALSLPLSCSYSFLIDNLLISCKMELV
jgi:hypothetical protein